MRVCNLVYVTLLCISFVVVVTSADPTPTTTQLPQKGNVRFGRVVEAPEFIAGSGLVVNLTSEGVVQANNIVSQSIKTDKLETDVLTTSYISSSVGSIVLDGDLVITQVAATSFLAEEIIVGGVRQWRLVRHEHFDKGAEGWSLLETSSCSANGDRFLGGHCNIAHGAISKTFDKLPPHKQLRVTARYHFIDNWKGETAFLKLGEQYAWSDRAHAASKGQGIHMCGSAEHAETRMSAPIDVTIPHEASFIEVAFGSEGREGEDACQRSFGVDDVMVYVR